MILCTNRMLCANNGQIKFTDTYRPSVFNDIIKDTQRPLFVLSGSAGSLERMNYNSPVYQINATYKTKHLRVTGSSKRHPPMNNDLNGSQNKGRENTL